MCKRVLANSRMYLLAAFLLLLFVAGTAFTSQIAYADSNLSAGEKAADQVEATTSPYSDLARIDLNATRITLKNNATYTLKATLVPAVNGTTVKNTKITWSVSNPKIARISQDGTVQGKASGTTEVIATAKNGVKATAKVKVSVNSNDMAKRIPVLTYHRVASNLSKSRFYQGDTLAVSASMFNRQMKWLHNNGYYTVSTEEFRDWRVEGAFLPKKSILITLDDGFYETYHVAYPILKKYNQKATSFIVGSRTGKKTNKYRPKSRVNHYIGRDVIKKIRKEYPNLEFQSHTYNMHHRASSGNGVATVYSRSRIDADFKKNSRYNFTAIAYPFGHTSKNLFASARANESINIGFGYQMTWSATRTSPLYNIPRFKVMGTEGLGSFINIARTAS